MVDVAPQLADVVARKIWRAYRPEQMSYVELLHLAGYALDYTEGDVDRAVELLDEVIDPALTYEENKKLLEKRIGRKIEPEIEYEKYVESLKKEVREYAEILSVGKEIEERARRAIEVEKPRAVGLPEFPYKPPVGFEDFYEEWMRRYKKLK